MQQTKKFINPVYASGGNNVPIDVGDGLSVLLRDGSFVTVTVTHVSEDGRSVSWAHTDDSVRKEDVIAVSFGHVHSCANYGGAYDPEALDPVSVI